MTATDVLGWRMRSACRDPQYNPDWWTPGQIGDDVARALWVCGGCPVIDQCAEWAKRNTQLCRGSVYGGTYYAVKLDGSRVRASTYQPKPLEPPPPGPPPPPQAPRVSYRHHHDEIATWAAAGISQADIAARLGGTREGVRIYMREQRIYVAGLGRAERCGSRAGYLRHRRRAEEPCAECRAAQAADSVRRREYKARRRAEGRAA
jgi:hypothetical protein